MVSRDDFDGVALEVVVQLAGGDKERDQELLRHGVACPCVTQYRADEVHRVLNEGGSVDEVLYLLRLGTSGVWPFVGAGRASGTPS